MAKTKPRLAYVLQDFHIGGMESLIYRIACDLAERYDIYFIATHVADILPKFHAIGTAVYIGQNWFKLTRYLHQQQIDLVQYGNVRIYGDAALAAGVPVVIERTDGLRQGAALKPKTGLDAVIASTAGTIDHISRLITRDKIHLIYNGIDLDYVDSLLVDRLYLTDEHFIIGRVSRFGQGKNLGLLIDAVRELSPHYPHIRLVLVGGNSQMPGAPDVEGELRQRAVGLEDYVIFTGYVEDPIPMIKGFDVGTCVSRWGNEGIPNSLLESMAAGRPVIGTAVDDIPEIIEDGVNGFLISDNDLSQLVSALERLITNSSLCQSMGQAGRTLIKTSFNLNQQARLYDDLYTHLLENRPSTLYLFVRRWRFMIGLIGKTGCDRLIPATIKMFLRRVRGKLLSMKQSS